MHLDWPAYLLVLAGGMDNPMTNAIEDAEKSRNAIWDRIAIGSAIAIAVRNGLFRRCILPELLLLFEGPIVVRMNLNLWFLPTCWSLAYQNIYLGRKEFVSLSVHEMGTVFLS